MDKLKPNTMDKLKPNTTYEVFIQRHPQVPLLPSRWQRFCRWLERLIYTECPDCGCEVSRWARREEKDEYD